MYRVKSTIFLALLLLLLSGSCFAATNKSTTHEIDLYVTSWCPYCKQAESWLDKQGLEYQRYDVEKDKAAAQRMYRLAGSGGIPFAVINGVSIKGWSPEAYAAALKKNE